MRAYTHTYVHSNIYIRALDTDVRVWRGVRGPGPMPCNGSSKKYQTIDTDC